MNNKQLKRLEKLAESLNYGSGPEHSMQVMKLSLKIYRDLVDLDMLVDSKNDRRLLRAIALLHNVGLPAKTHNLASFDILKEKIPDALGQSPLRSKDLSAILYGVLWHRGNIFKKRDNVKIIKRAHLKELASIVRVADALDRSFEQIVDDISLNRKGDSLEFIVQSRRPADEEIERSKEKADLLLEAFGLDGVNFKTAEHIASAS